MWFECALKFEKCFSREHLAWFGIMTIGLDLRCPNPSLHCCGDMIALVIVNPFFF